MSDHADDLEAARATALHRLRAETGHQPNGDVAASDERGDGGYAGLATRVIAFSLDAALVTAAGFVVGVGVGLGLSILHLPSQVDKAIAALGGAVFLLWNVGYFVVFWATTGQTPGNRLLHIRVIDANSGATIKPWRAATRFGALWVGVIPLGAGIWRMLWDGKRRCFQDRFTRTVVVYTPDHRPPPSVMSRRAHLDDRRAGAAIVRPPALLPPATTEAAGDGPLAAARDRTPDAGAD